MSDLIEVTEERMQVIVDDDGNVTVVDIGEQGPPGVQGPKGDPGEGVPAGGAVGQVLAKSGATDYATGWATVASVLGYTPANDTTVVHLSGNESISGIKTFAEIEVASVNVTSSLDLGTNRIIGVGDPIGLQDAATKSYVDLSSTNIIGGAPTSLDTLGKLATAINNDPSFATSINTAISARALDTSVVHNTGDETIAGIKTFTSRIIIRLPDISPGIPDAPEDGAICIMGDDDTVHLRIFANLNSPGPGTYDTEIHTLDNGYWSSDLQIHFRPRYAPQGTEYSRIVLEADTTLHSNVGTNWMLSGRNYSASTKNDLAIGEYERNVASYKQWLRLSQLDNGWMLLGGSGTAGSPDRPLAPLHVKPVLGSPPVTVGFFETTAATSRISFRASGSTTNTGVAVGANNDDLVLRAGATDALRLSAGVLTFTNAVNIAFNATTGTKIGTANSQKLAFWNATPIVQPTTAIAAATRIAGSGSPVLVDDTFDGYNFGQVVKALRNMGALA